MKVPAPLRTPLGAAVLSALFPGLGQAAAGMPRRGAIIAIPMLSLTAAVLLVLILDRSSLMGAVVNQGWLTSLLLLDLAALVYHLWAIADAYVIAARTRPGVRRPRGAPPVATLKWSAVSAIAVILVGTVGVHGVVAQQDMQWQHTLYCLTAKTPCWITDGGVAQASASAGDNGDNGDVIDTPSPGTTTGPSPSLATFDLSNLPTFQTTTDSENWAQDGQLNVMLIGIGVQNNASALGPDTIMVMHLDIASGKAAFIGIGRNNVCVPLPQEFAANFATGSAGCPAYTWPSMINALPNAVLGNCRKFPVPGMTDTCGQSGDPNRYQRAIVAFQMTIGSLLGLNMDGSVWINPNGLTQVINDLGGIDINVPTTVYDKPCGPAGSWQATAGNYICNGQYHNGYSVPNGVDGVQAMKAAAADPSANGKQSISWSQGQDIAFVIKAGQQHMSGEWALAYSRTRVYTNGGDFSRMARQQLVLKALRTTFDPCQIVGSVPKLLGSVAAIPYAFNTNLPLSNASDINAWASLAKRVLGGNIKSVIMDPATVGQSFLNGYPAVDATSWAKFKDLTAHSLDAIPAASASGGTSGSTGC